VQKRPKSATGRRETNRGARLGDVDAFDLQHDFGERAVLVGGHVRRQDSGRFSDGLAEVKFDMAVIIVRLTKISPQPR